jgi:hypothetical protein
MARDTRAVCSYVEVSFQRPYSPADRAPRTHRGASQCPRTKPPIRPFTLSLRRFTEHTFGYTDGMDELRRDPMMARLIDDLQAGTDIGHFGRLVLVMVARHFMDEDELVELLANDHDFSEEKARVMVREVIDAGYSPPKREKIREFQSRQDYAIIEDTGDPDAGNVYKHLRFPDDVYEHIEHYREQKILAEH